MDRLEKIIRELTPEQFPEQYQEIVIAIGVDAFLKLIAVCGGTAFYLPNFKKFMSDIRKSLILSEFDKTHNYIACAKKLGVTERWVRELVSKGRLKSVKAF